MRLLVITADKERAGDMLSPLENLGVAIGYLETGQQLPAGELPERLMERECEAEAVLLYVYGEVIPSGLICRIRHVLAAPLVVYSENPGYYQEMQCFQAGADDYQGPDCRMPLLHQRMLRLIRIYQGSLSGMLARGGLLEDPDAQQFYDGGRSLQLTGKEYEVLRWLLHSREEIVPKEKLLVQIWGEESPQNSRALDTLMKQLRRKLAGSPVLVRTCYGRGYRLKNRAAGSGMEG